MNYKKWVWCLHCEQAFEVHLSYEPKLIDGMWEGPFAFTPDFEMQLGKELNGVIYAECPYADCDGDMKYFWWWDEYRREHPDTPEMPQTLTTYPLYR